MLALAACSGESAGEPSDTVELDILSPSIVTCVDSRAKPIEGHFFSYHSPTDYGKDYYGYVYYAHYDISTFVCDKGTLNGHLSNSLNELIRLQVHKPGFTTIPEYAWLSSMPGARIGANIVVYAYYPYVSGSFKPDSVPFTTNQQYDWMWADPVTIDNVSSTNRTAPVRFHHAMTCVEIRLSTLYNGTVDLNSITMTDAKNSLVASGTIDIRNGALNYKEENKTSSITINGYYNSERIPTHVADNSSYRSFCFLMPEKDFEAGDLVLSFKFDNVAGRVDFTIPTTFKDGDGNDITVTKFETGKRYILNLLIDNTTLIYPLNFVVDDWTGVDVNLKI